ncbi:MAG: guanitoxin biosynthesis MATE family efflux transporter GntT [Rhizonema sp. NSF051]|nr:guanitoxin biosynthesis MATE family efflux transporter GntT [Rhizonema sp. NSF051]
MPFSQKPTFLYQFFKLSTINILSNLMVPFSGLMDVAFLGHLVEIRHLAGVTLATVLFNYIYWTFGFLRMATTGMTAQAMGREDNESVLLIGLRHAVLALGLGLTILVCQQPLRLLGFALLNATPEVKASGEAFYNALIWGAPATLINFVLIGWFLGREQSNKVLLLSVVSNGANVLLDYIFIVRWGWASRGAGLATAASQYLMLLVGILLFCQEIKFKQVKGLTGKLFELSALKDAFTLNGEILIRTLALISTFAMFTNLSAALGTVVLTTNAVLMQVVSLAAYLIDGLAFSTEILAGVFRGKGTTEGLIRLVQVSGGTSLILGLMFAIAFIISPQPLFGLLTNHTEIIAGLYRYVPWLLPVLGFGSIAYMLDGYFLGLTQGSTLRQSTLIATLVGFIPMAIAAWYFGSNNLLWLSLSLFMVARAFTLGLQVPRTLRKPIA